MASDDRELRRRLEHADHVDLAPEVVLERFECGSARRVARDHQQLCSLIQQMVGDLDRKRLQLLLSAVAIGEALGVTEVQVVLRRQGHQQLVEDSESSDA